MLRLPLSALFLLTVQGRVTEPLGALSASLEKIELTESTNEGDPKEGMVGTNPYPWCWEDHLKFSKAAKKYFNEGGNCCYGRCGPKLPNWLEKCGEHTWLGFALKNKGEDMDRCEGRHEGAALCCRDPAEDGN